MIFTFYSFKGGVGRSMAMAGVASVFASRGLRVLAIDFDLEAPGLERYFLPESHAREARGQPGLIDLICDYKLALSDEVEAENPRFLRWRDYLTEAIPNAGHGGLVDILLAGRREPLEKLRQYSHIIRSFDWEEFFLNWKGEEFFGWLRRVLTNTSADNELERGYDVVLVDSRTGVTEMGGICAYQLADVAVMLCAANYQNIDGIWDVCQDFRSESVLALRRGRPLELLVVPARIESANSKFVELLAQMNQRFGTNGLPMRLAQVDLTYERLSLPYDPEFAIAERLVGGEEAETPSRSKLLSAYATLADALTLLAESGRLGEQIPMATARVKGEAMPEPQSLVADPTQKFSGYDLFVDYAAVDSSRAKAIIQQLSDAGFSCIEPCALELGTEAAKTIFRNLGLSHRLLPLLGENGPSPWLEALLGEARKQGRPPILPVLLREDPACRGLLRSYGLDSLQPVVLATETEETLSAAVLVDALRNLKRAGTPHAAPDHPPYPGLHPCTEDYAAGFFGRDREIDELVEAVNSHSRVWLSGATGVGKTSLVKAGLIPRLRRPDSTIGMGSSLRVDYVDLADPQQQQTCADRLLRPSETPQLVLLDGLDSFPEGGRPSQRSERLRLIADILNKLPKQVRVLLVWRDTLDEPERAEAIRLLSGPDCYWMEVCPLFGAGLIQAIESPAVQRGHLFEPGLVKRLTDAVGMASSGVAQLQRVLPLLWQERSRGWLTNKAYDALDGVAGQFSEHLKSALETMPEELSQAAQTLLMNLLQFDRQLHPVPEPREWRFLASIAQIQAIDGVALRDILVRQRFLELYHESESRKVLCRLPQPATVTYLKELARNDVEFILWRQRFATYVHSFVERGRDPAYNLPNDALSEAEYWVASRHDQLSQDERDLLDASLRLRGNQRKKKLIVFCGGTWNSTDVESMWMNLSQWARERAWPQPCPTNVDRLAEAICPFDDAGNPQITHHIYGVGTRKLERIRGGGFGYGISKDIKEAYKFICSNYRPGDEIFIFGYSRGACVARSLAGLIHAVGILKRQTQTLINEAYWAYKNRSVEWHPQSEQAISFREAYAWGDERIRFLGVWETVGELGMPFGKGLSWLVDKLFKVGFHDTQLSNRIQSAYHALAIDERRYTFRPTLWSLGPGHDRNGFEEKWFVGVHGDVGGGYSNTGLSDISLGWMAEKARQQGLSIDLHALANPPFKPNASAPIHESQTLFYRLATLIFVGLPSRLGILPGPAHSPGLIEWGGDYLRPIPEKEAVHPSVFDKMASDPNYRPPNLEKYWPST